MSMKTWEAKVYVRSGNSRIPHTVRIKAQSSFAAREMFNAQYGANNVIGIPYEVKSGGSKHNPAPWMERL